MASPRATRVAKSCTLLPGETPQSSVDVVVVPLTDQRHAEHFTVHMVDDAVFTNVDTTKWKARERHRVMRFWILEKVEEGCYYLAKLSRVKRAEKLETIMGYVYQHVSSLCRRSARTCCVFSAPR